MARRKSDDDDGSLDSLLDTMTNVVAILVILLIVTQLGVSDAVKRIVQTNPVDPEEVANTRKKIQRQQRRVETLEALAVASPESPEEIQFKLKNTLELIASTEKQIKELEAQNQSLILLAAAESAQKSKRADLEKIEQEIQEKLAGIQKVNAQLEAVPVREAVPTEVIHLPNPRPAPRGAKPFLMLVKQNKVYPLNYELFRQKAEAKALQIIEKAKLNRDPKQGIDPVKFLNLFNKQKLRDTFFEVTMKANGPTPVLVFHPLERKGVTQKLITNKSGPFWKSIASMNPEKLYISFLVWSDSFETYLVVRQACAEVGLAAGWAPQTTTKPYERNLGGRLRFGPPPPPPDPTTPKKAPNPKAPAKKPVPVDTID